jgi:cytoskeletal protein RodZ
MDPLEKIERKRQTRHRLRAQRERAGRLRARVVAISLICFVLLWGVVFVQMATGNDPVLGDSSSAVVKGSDGRNRHAAKAAPAEASTDSEEFRATELEELELEEEAFAEEPVEEEFIEEEPAPVTTSQS